MREGVGRGCPQLFIDLPPIGLQFGNCELLRSSWVGGGWDGILGDVNSDFEINVLDVVLLVNFVLVIDEPNEYQFFLSDINGDAAIDILDVVQLINIILNR